MNRYRERDLAWERGEGRGTGAVLAGVLGLVWVSVFFAKAPWVGFHGVMFAVAGLLMLWRPPVVKIPNLWKALALAFLLLSLGWLCPVDWVGVPEWRKGLANLGLPLGDRQAIQVGQALEGWVLGAGLVGVALWLCGFRVSGRVARWVALGFSLGVAVCALISRWWYLNGEHVNVFGFFSNRNHTATYLAMGAMTGFGLTLQAGRDRRWGVLAAALCALLVNVLAATLWSISRGGVLLLLTGVVLWLPMLGRRYLGRHGTWAVFLVVLTAAGFFLLVENGARGRLEESAERARKIFGQGEVEGLAAELAPGRPERLEDFDFRVPTLLDTLDMMRAQPWTGVGVWQYNEIFPQYRQRTATMQHADNFHPESDWLWVAAETGVPSALVLLALVVLAFGRGLRQAGMERDRALRTACLVAALLVPVHGLFSVPMHRASLAWAGAALFVLALPVPREGRGRGTRGAGRAGERLPWAPGWRALGGGIMLVGLAGIGSEWLGWRAWPSMAARDALRQARELYREDTAQRKKAEQEEKSYNPDPGEDPVERALAVLERAEARAPMNRMLWRYDGFLTLFFDDKLERTKRVFAISRALDPAWVDGVLQQAEQISDLDVEESARLCAEAVRRARRIDELTPGSEDVRQRVLKTMAAKAKKVAGFQLYLEKAREEDGKTPGGAG